jgi:hypothetical protein
MKKQKRHKNKQRKFIQALLPGIFIVAALGMIIILTELKTTEPKIVIKELETITRETGEVEELQEQEQEQDAKEPTKERQEEISKKEDTIKEKDTESKTQEKSLKQIVYGFIGAPYELGPLGEGEGEKIYRTDVFDCTTLVLVSASKFFSNGASPEEIMKKANYYPSEEVSYETRLHFSSYRNQVSPFFKDITEQVGGEKTEEKTVVLNKNRGEEGRIINIDWEKEIILKYIKKENVSGIISQIPPEAGVAFIIDGDEEIGLDIRHEGFLFDRENLVHASEKKKKVTEDNFLELLEKSGYSGVIFFEIKRLF